MKRNVVPDQLHERLGKDRQAALKVDCATTVNVPITDDARERIDRPLLLLDSDYVSVRCEQHRLSGPIPFQPRDKVRLSPIRSRHNLDFKAQRAQASRKKVGNLLGASGGIAGVDLNEL